MKILIVGSKGFIGSSLAVYFSKNINYEVFECDVAVDYQKKNYIVIDASNSDFHTVFSENNFDLCINCSGAASVPDSIIHPLRDYNLNTYNVFKMLDAIRLHQPKCKFINLSSAAVYGNPLTLPVKESFLPAPISPYGNHKLQAEMICKEFFDYYSIQSCSLRIFSAYGVGLTKQLLWDLNKKFVTSDVIELFGTGKESRDFINIKDLLIAIECCLNANKFDADIINIANGVEITVQQIVDIFKQHFSETKQVKFNGIVKAGDPLYWRADVTLLKSLGYSPTVAIEDGIAEYIRWAKTI
ncbi:NAD-dependent epimerase/dehydratase family protein [Mucilaginibacter sp. FT3.2]|uniref:NAD-dependent epimerase/dehydratase family protein n=1 Tax=Mucilaginibacter sp. FT3.2 TaxID=2723090 RepID=UPI00161867DC|nr:NAD-dependent epimerase/dehydratase family protein [Mucilaginibacter sp. FT3.2]MBB6230170.1 dTDP-glucose 4,6-dehydratase/UDP-glucose 4-epimerase [Mucilaginibacter sp. FT3.2]